MNTSTRRAFLSDLARLGASMAGLGALAGCAPARPGSTPARVYRVGVLTIPSSGLVIPQFWARLAELGYVEGQNLVKMDRSAAEDNPAVLGPLAMQLASLPVDAIVAGNTASIRAAMAASTSIPIVMMNAVVDPVELGFVASLARPGGNVTGVVGITNILFAKRLQQLVEAAPTVSKVAVLTSTNASLEPLQAAAQTLGVALVPELVQTRDGINAAVEHAVAEGADALLTAGGSVPGNNSDLIIELADRHRLPASYGRGEFVRAGGLMAYEPRVSEIGRRVADYVDRILRGANPADLPVELPTRYDFTLNLRTARALGLTLSQTFLAQVDEVIE
ncbi:MAG: transporter substrate binding protein [Chloroflexi bacterium]|nr:transporter substrate binding protein [Chloroflexota bacterium]